MKRTLSTLVLIITCLMWTTSSFAQGIGSRCRVDPRCGGIGGGDGSDLIICDWPGKTNMVKEVVNLSWNEIEGASSYTITIKDRSDILSSVTVHTQTAFTNHATIDLSQIDLQMNKEYDLSIESDHGKKGSGSKFILKPTQDYFSDLVSYHSTNDVSHLSLVDSRLRLANFLAEKGWNYAAVREHRLDEEMGFLDKKKTMDNLWALIMKWEPLPGDE